MSKKLAAFKIERITNFPLCMHTKKGALSHPSFHFSLGWKAKTYYP